MKAHARAVKAAFKQQFKVMCTPLGMLFPFFNSLGPAVTVGYVVGRSGNDGDFLCLRGSVIDGLVEHRRVHHGLVAIR
jgi:hypothetical protein